MNVTEIHNVYNTTVINNTTVTRVSYNGGNGGISARPTAQEEAAAQERHIRAGSRADSTCAGGPSQPAATGVRELWASLRSQPHLSPEIFNDRAVVPAKAAGAPYTLQPIVAEISRATMRQPRVQRTTLLEPAPPVHPATFRPLHNPTLRIQAIRSWTRSTSSSRTSKSRSRNRNGRNSSRSRTRNTSSWRNRTPTKRESSR